MDGGSEQTFTDSTPVTKDITVYAKFKGNEYSATFKWWNDKTSGPFKVEYPDPLSSAAGFTLPEVGARANYTDNGGGKWYFNGVAVDGDTVLTGSITASPVWKGNSYTVKFHHNDGTETRTSVTVNYPDGDMTAKPEMKVNEFPTLKWTNHIFDDWRTAKAAAGNAFAAGAVINGDTDVYAHWMGASGAEVRYGSLTTAKTTGTVEGATLSYTLQIPSFVASGDYVSASLQPTSTAGSVSRQSDTFSSITGDKTFTVKSPASGKNYNYKVTVLQKSLANTQMATGGTTTFVRSNTTGSSSSTWDEVHTFTHTDTSKISTTHKFSFSRRPSGLTGWVLVVAGGGGAGGGSYPSSGAGAGGMVENTTYPLSSDSYEVKVGAGGAGGKGSNNDSDAKDGTKGNDSSFGSGITAYGGGNSKARGGSTQPGKGNSGGSTGGGGSSETITTGNGGDSYGHQGGTATNATNNGGEDYADYAAGGGGAGSDGISGYIRSDNSTGLYAGAGKNSSITGAPVMYAKGGPTTPRNGNTGTNFTGIAGAANTGNGGGGAWNAYGGSGGSGIVIVRFKFSE
jgi:hypothetical protein